jgi:hypothetical protein
MHVTWQALDTHTTVPICVRLRNCVAALQIAQAMLSTASIYTRQCMQANCFSPAVALRACCIINGGKKCSFITTKLSYCGYCSLCGYPTPVWRKTTPIALSRTRSSRWPVVLWVL